MAAEWMAALSGFGAKTVHNAISKVIADSKWWPTIAEVRTICKADDDSWRDALGLKDDPTDRRRLSAPPRNGFCREGRTEAEEIAYRASVILKAKLAYTPAIDAWDEMQTKTPPVPASQAQWISPELEAIARKRGYWRGAA